MTPSPHRDPASILLVRHAQSEHHVRGLTGGWTDTGLTSLGEQQAQLLAARLGAELRGVPLTLYTSDLLRCTQTTRHVAEALGAAPVPDPRLREHNNGVTAGLTTAEAAARFPDTYNTLWTIDLRPFPGAETWCEFSHRLAGLVEELPADGPLPVLVTHGGAIMTIVAWWLRLDPDGVQRHWFGAPPASITVLRSDAWGLRGLERLGDIAHLYGTAAWPAAPLA